MTAVFADTFYLTDEERSEYEALLVTSPAQRSLAQRSVKGRSAYLKAGPALCRLINAADFIGILKVKARRRLGSNARSRRVCASKGVEMSLDTARRRARATPW